MNESEHELATEVVGLELRIEELTFALLDQWDAAHFDHCGTLPHPKGKGFCCLWPPPDVLGLSPNEAYEALEKHRSA